MTGIIYRPIVTEKVANLQDKGVYAFAVDPNANKIDIARAVSKKFNVTVTNVRTINIHGKTKSQMTRHGKFTGRTAHYKKAIITIKEGEKIDLFGNV